MNFTLLNFIFFLFASTLSLSPGLIACQSHTDSIMTLMKKKTTNRSQWIVNTMGLSIPENHLEFFLKNRIYFSKMVEELAHRYRYSNIDAIGIFDPKEHLLGMSLAYELHLPLVQLTSETLNDLHEKKIIILTNIVSYDQLPFQACKWAEDAGAKVEEIACLIEQNCNQIRKFPTPYELFSLVAIETKSKE